MAKDFVFWKQDFPYDREPPYIYMSVCSNSHLDELVELPLKEIFADLKIQFPNMVSKETSRLVVLENSPVRFTQIVGGVEKEYRSEMKFTWNKQHVAVEFAGKVEDETKEKIIKTMARYGCPLYDTYLGKRYDGANGLELGEFPNLPERRERIIQQVAQDTKSAMRANPSLHRIRRQIAFCSLIAGLALGIVGYLTGSLVSPVVGILGCIILGLIGLFLCGKYVFASWYVLQKLTGLK